MSDPHFDVVVVGSGFGGSVMAYRLAEAGKLSKKELVAEEQARRAAAGHDKAQADSEG